jgi:copper chaperone NosL
MKGFWRQFNEILGRPVAARSRALLVLGLVPLALSFLWPLWNIHMRAPQYPDGLELRIYAQTVEGDIQEVNTLNHYIGMHHIDRAELSDLDWIPFAIGVLALLALRLAAIGDVRGLVDLTVLTLYFCLFSAGRFVYKLYVYGHNLDPRAPVTVPGFMPPVLGTQQVGNFSVTSVPGPATFLIGVFVAALVALVVAHAALPLLRRGGNTSGPGSQRA